MQKMRSFPKISPAVLYAGVFLLLFMGCMSVFGQDEGGTSLERRVEEVLSRIQGAGEVRVLINSGQDQALSAWSMIGISEPEREITGVLVVAQGAADPAVAARLAQAVGTVLQVDQSAICIMHMEK